MGSAALAAPAGELLADGKLQSRKRERISVLVKQAAAKQPPEVGARVIAAKDAVLGIVVIDGAGTTVRVGNPGRAGKADDDRGEANSGAQDLVELRARVGACREDDSSPILGNERQP
jgi:hypothetical protein